MPGHSLRARKLLIATATASEPNGGPYSRRAIDLAEVGTALHDGEASPALGEQMRQWNAALRRKKATAATIADGRDDRFRIDADVKVDRFSRPGVCDSVGDGLADRCRNVFGVPPSEVMNVDEPPHRHAGRDGEGWQRRNA